MNESLDKANKELKRADHLMFVSLKYTRTVDVIKSVVERLITAMDSGMDSLILYAKEKGKLNEVPRLPSQKVESVIKLYSEDENIRNFMEFYSLLRKIDKAQFERSQEYRRHVTMTATVDNKQIEVTIDIINDYFKKTKEFINLVQKIVLEIKDE